MRLRKTSIGGGWRSSWNRDTSRTPASGSDRPEGIGLLNTVEDFKAILAKLYGEDPPPKPLILFRALDRVRQGEPVREIAKAVRSTAKNLESLATATDPIARILGTDLSAAASEQRMVKARATLGQLLLGVIAERAFEQIYKTRMGTTELRLEDYRDSRNETDYRILNGRGLPVFRINIKFHGTRFRNAAVLVGLDPADCFALATYKIYQALQKQEKEVLPYIFAIVGVADLTGALVGEAFPEDLVHLNSLILGSKISGKRDIEDRIVLHLLDTPQPDSVRTKVDEFARRIREAEWRVISARKADDLLRKKLFDRVYAVRVRAFARNYPNAELDMHLSLNEDLTRLQEFLDLLKTRGLHGLTAHLERGLV